MVIRSAAILLIFLILFSITGCKNTKKDKAPDEISVTFPEETTGKPFHLFTADCRGDESPELVFASAEHILIYNADGRLLLQKDLNGIGLIPAIFADTDCDTKADIVYGSMSSGKNRIHVYNGMGYLISSFTEETLGHDFCCLTPVYAADRLLIAAARPADVESPRGFLFLDSFSLQQLFLFQSPDPLDLVSLSSDNGLNPDLLILSYMNRHDGNFRRYGKPDNEKTDAEYEVGNFILTIDLHGNRVGEHEVINTDIDPTGSLHYESIAGNSDEVLLFHSYNDDMEQDAFKILKIRASDGEVLNCSSSFHAEYLSSISFPGHETRTAVVSATDTASSLKIFSSELCELAAFSFKGRPKLIPSLETEPGVFILPVITDRGIITIDTNFQTTELITETGIENVSFFKRDGKLMLVIQNRNGFKILPFPNL